MGSGVRCCRVSSPTKKSNAALPLAADASLVCAGWVNRVQAFASGASHVSADRWLRPPSCRRISADRLLSGVTPGQAQGPARLGYPRRTGTFCDALSGGLIPLGIPPTCCSPLGGSPWHVAGYFVLLPGVTIDWHTPTLAPRCGFACTPTYCRLGSGTSEELLRSKGSRTWTRLVCTVTDEWGCRLPRRRADQVQLPLFETTESPLPSDHGPSSHLLHLVAAVGPV